MVAVRGAEQRQRMAKERRIMEKTNFNLLQSMHDLAFPCRPKVADDINDDSAHTYMHELRLESV